MAVLPATALPMRQPMPNGDQRPMKVLMVENGRGGYTRYTCDLSKHLAALGADVHYLASREHAAEAQCGVDLHPVLRPNSPVMDGTGKLGFASRRLVWSLQSLSAIYRFARRCDPDVIHLQTATPASYCHLLPLLRQRWPLILTVHDVLPHHGTKLLKSIEHLRKLYMAVDHVIVHTEANRRTLIDTFDIPRERIEVIAHGADASAPVLSKAQARRQLSLPPTERIVVSLGVIRTNKRLDLLIDAVAAALQSRGDIRLVIAGRPSSVSAEQVSAMLRSAGIEEHAITRFGWLDDDEIGLYLDACDTCVLPYVDFDAQSGVLMQALAHAAPLIVSDEGSLAETVQGAGAGLVFRRNDARALAARLLEMLGSPALQRQCASNARQAVREVLDWRLIAAATLRSYRNVCNLPADARTSLTPTA
jgi:glycosyltransferase involved in cell wall biosynthesis